MKFRALLYRLQSECLGFILARAINIQQFYKNPFLHQIMNIPESWKPTKVTTNALSIIFVLVLIIGITKFPLSSLMSGNLDKSFSIGIPLPFLELSFSGETSNPLHIFNFIIDLLIYFILAYLIDIGFHAVKNSKTFKKEEPLVEKKKE